MQTVVQMYLCIYVFIFPPSFLFLVFFLVFSNHVCIFRCRINRKHSTTTTETMEMYNELDNSEGYRRMGERAPKKSFKRFAPILLAALHFLIFLFVLIATPVDTFKARKNAINVAKCASMFGWKPCGAHGTTGGFKCGIKSNMNGAAAFAIISILVTLVSFILYILSMLDIFKKYFMLLILDGVAWLTTLISWACVAQVYNAGKCATLPYSSRVKDHYQYAGSFGLMVTAWVLVMLTFLGVLFIPLQNR